MSLHRKQKIRRWTIRILAIIILLPVAVMLLFRTTGWLRMRKSDWDIKASLQTYNIQDTIIIVSLQGRHISYLKTSLAGANNQAVIFVHGSPGSLDAWLDFMTDTALLKRVDLVSYDRPGYGNSDFGKSMPSLSDQSDILYALMKSLGYRHYWLVGHSYGATILLQAAQRHPELVLGICLIAGSISPELEPKSVAWRKCLDLPLIRGILPVALRVSNEELMPIRQDLLMVEDDWDRLTMPVSIIHGTKDILVPFENAQYAKEKLTNADTVFMHVLDQESHFIVWTQEQIIVNALAELLDFDKLKTKN